MNYDLYCEGKDVRFEDSIMNDRKVNDIIEFIKQAGTEYILTTDSIELNNEYEDFLSK